MKKIILVLIVLLVGLLNFPSCMEMQPAESVDYTELGIPLLEQYPDGSSARCPWDMIIWKNQLYIGGGNFDSNAGPVDIWRYSISEKCWEISGTVPDEEVNRFCIIDNTLVLPGIDPREDYKFGNYYRWDDSTWSTIRNIPRAYHCFDMVEYDGMIFVGLGVDAGDYPIAYSTNGGKTFASVEMRKDGVPFDTSFI